MSGKRCLGWPVGTPCDNEPGTPWAEDWCHTCDQKRRQHLDKRFKELEAHFARKAAGGSDG